MTIILAEFKSILTLNSGEISIYQYWAHFYNYYNRVKTPGMLHRNYNYDQPSEHFLSGLRLFLPLHSNFPQSWHPFIQKVRPPLPLQSCLPHLQQCRGLLLLCVTSSVPVIDIVNLELSGR